MIGAGGFKRRKRFVMCSSMARYGTQDKVPFTEDLVRSLRILMESENMHLNFFSKIFQKHMGMDYVIAVPHNIVGTKAEI